MSTYQKALPRPSLFVGRTSSGQTFTVVDRIAEIDPRAWEAAFPSGWKDYRYYQTLEETFAEQFPQRYLILENPGGDGDIAAILPFFFAHQDLTVSLHSRLRALLKPVRSWLQLKILMAGCIVGEAQIGVVAGPGQLATVCNVLAEALEHYARYERVPIILWKDMPAAYRSALKGLEQINQYTRLPSLPGVGLKLDFGSFEEYLQTRLGKATRKNLRRKFRDVEAAEPITLEVKCAIDAAEAQTLHALYEGVARRGDVHFEVFTKEYFLRLSERMPEHTRYFIWRQAGRVIAFTFCTVHEGAIYDNDLGLDEQLASRLHLYHVTFRDVIRWALANGLTHYYSSPFNYDPKWHLQMTLLPRDLYAHHTNSLINTVLRRLAPLMAPTRQEPLLKRFANAGDLE